MSLPWIEKITPGDLDANMREVYEAARELLADRFRGAELESVALKTALKIQATLQGREVYFKKITDCYRDVWQAELKRRWRKHNLAELAREFNLTERRVREIVNDHESQIDLFPPAD